MTQEFNIDVLKQLRDGGIKNLYFDTSLLAWVAGQQPLLHTENLEVSGSMEVTNFPDNPTTKYKASDIDDVGNPEYYGFLKNDGGWYILKITDGNNMRYCKGDTDYSTNWNNRATTLTYQLFHLVF